MNDHFLVKFALGTLVVISFALQHGSQMAGRKINISGPNDKVAAWVICIMIMQLCSIGIIVEIINYALRK